MGYTSTSSEDDDFKSKKQKKQSLKKYKRKKEKKQKKKSKRHKRMSTSTDSSSDSEPKWVENQPAASVVPGRKLPDQVSMKEDDSAVAKDPITTGGGGKEDNDWSSFSDFIPTYSNSAKKEKRQTKKEWDAVRSASKPGQHSRELNPYWKDGGDGLPCVEDSQSQDRKVNDTVPQPSIGDGGLHWLRKAYQRAKEQAAEEGRSLEDVAAERWGSLSNFYSMLEEAEEKLKNKDLRSNSPYHGDGMMTGSRTGSSFRKPRRDSGSDEEAEQRRPGSRNRRHEELSSSQSSRHHPSWMKAKSESIRSFPPDRIDEPSPLRIAVSEPSLSLQRPIPEQRLENDSAEPDDEKPSVTVLSDQEMNALSAKILKAEMLGNTDLALKLKTQHAEAEANRQEFIKGGGNTKNPSQNSTNKIVTKIVMDSQNRGGRRKDKPTETHQDGKRVRYFPDDDKQTLQNMFQREKSNTVENENALFSRLAGKGMKSKPTDDYDLDDIFADKASSVKKGEKEKEREVQKVISDDKFYKKMVDDCPWCFDGKKLEKHIVASMAEKTYLCVPPFQSLSEGHCLIVPMFHVSSATELDEDVWEEMQKFRRSLVRMFKEDDQDLIIFETAMSLQRHPHMYLECVPIPKETGELAPIYFKKAIQECESEWSQNKKLVELRDRGVRKAIPKGLPYFSVDFGDDSGFAHVIEDEKNFPRNFAQEIIGGMMELDHSIWRKRKNDNFKEQRQKVMKFLESWGPFDWTRDG